MDGQTETVQSPNYSTLAQFAQAAHVSVERVRADLRSGRIRADKPGTEYLFTYEQWRDGLAYYARLAARQSGAR